MKGDSKFRFSVFTLDKTVHVESVKPNTVTLWFQRAPYGDVRYRHEYYELKVVESRDLLTLARNHSTGRYIAPITIQKVYIAHTYIHAYIYT